MKNLYVLFLLFVFTFYASAAENLNQNVNEISIGISVSSSGSMGEVSGLHTAIYGNPGYNVKKVRLTDDTLRTEDYAVNFGLQWNKFALTQYDSFTGLPLTRNRLINSSEWKDEEIKKNALEENGK